MLEHKKIIITFKQPVHFFRWSPELPPLLEIAEFCQKKYIHTLFAKHCARFLHCYSAHRRSNLWVNGTVRGLNAISVRRFYSWYAKNIPTNHSFINKIKLKCLMIIDFWLCLRPHGCKNKSPWESPVTRPCRGMSLKRNSSSLPSKKGRAILPNGVSS